MKKVLLLLIAAYILIFSASPAVCGSLNNAGWTVCVSLVAQKTYIYKNDELERILPCSTGVPGTADATPEGTFILNETGKDRGSQFYSPRYGDTAVFWVGFIGGTYVFRSVALGADGKALNSALSKLGQPVTHGSVCFSEDDAHWFYRNVLDRSRVQICGEWDAGSTGVTCSIRTKDDVSAFLASDMDGYRQKHLLSCEIALTRLSLALIGIRNLSENAILDIIPKDGTDPEHFFVCDDIDAGRRNRDGSIHWNNYGTHPPVVVNIINSFMRLYHANSSWSVQEMHADDVQLREMIRNDPSFRGAILWLVGHPERWGTNPPVNERGMVLGEHVRFLEPVLGSGGCFRIRDPETGRLIESEHTGAGRNLFSYRIAALFQS